MKLQFPLAKPTRANGALLPAFLAGALSLMAALQFALTSDVELPDPGWSGSGTRASMPRIAGSATPAILLQSPIFSPARTASVAGAEGSVLGGAAVAGAVTVRGRSYAVIQRPDGQVVRLPVGGQLAGKQLVALSPDGAVFRADGKTIRVAYGVATVQPPAPEAETEEESE